MLYTSPWSSVHDFKLKLKYLLSLNKYKFEILRKSHVSCPKAMIYGSWIYNYLCNQCLSPLMLWVRISIRARCTALCDKACQWLATGRWFSPGLSVFSKIINIWVWAWNHEQQEVHMCQLGTTCRITGEPCILYTHISYFVSYPTPALLLPSQPPLFSGRGNFRKSWILNLELGSACWWRAIFSRRPESGGWGGIVEADWKWGEASEDVSKVETSFQD
jgi:hypothetical protein